MQLLEFTPLYMERVWGGRNFESKLGRRLPPGNLFGESWEIVDRPNQQSVVASGLLAGQTIRQLIQHYASEILGPGGNPQEPFPILVKWLDCSQRLSLQVHPPAKVAKVLMGEPKTENWYIADADTDASIIIGLRRGTTRNDFETALAEGRIADCVRRLSTTSGDSILVKSGCVHAINAGNLILEIQQNSDTTYRVHDWDRVGMDGSSRQLHIRESLQSINFDLPEATLLKPRPGEQLLADSNEFRIRKFTLTPDAPPISFPKGEQPRLLHIISGRLRDRASEQVLQSSKNYLQPYVTQLSLTAETDTTLLVTDRFLV